MEGGALTGGRLFVGEDDEGDGRQRQLALAPVRQRGGRYLDEEREALERLGKRAEVVTHTRGISAPPPASSPAYLKMQLFVRLLGRKVNCCS